MMTNYQLFFKQKALQELVILPKIEQQQFLKLTKQITKNPFQVGMKLLPGFIDIFRLRVKGMKIIYEIQEDKAKLVIWSVASKLVSDLYPHK